jgi:hypothetical protein
MARKRAAQARMGIQTILGRAVTCEAPTKTPSRRMRVVELATRVKFPTYKNGMWGTQTLLEIFKLRRISEEEFSSGQGRRLRRI